jgi:hypothetical protein
MLQQPYQIVLQRYRAGLLRRHAPEEGTTNSHAFRLGWYSNSAFWIACGVLDAHLVEEGSLRKGPALGSHLGVDTRQGVDNLLLDSLEVGSLLSQQGALGMMRSIVNQGSVTNMNHASLCMEIHVCLSNGKQDH